MKTRQKYKLLTLWNFFEKIFLVGDLIKLLKFLPPRLPPRNAKPATRADYRGIQAGRTGLEPSP